MESRHHEHQHTYAPTTDYFARGGTYTYSDSVHTAHVFFFHFLCVCACACACARVCLCARSKLCIYSIHIQLLLLWLIRAVAHIEVATIQ